VSVIAVANQKGGVGKTTTAVTLAHGLALQGFDVLLVDLDPQGNVADSLGLKKGPSLYQLLVDKAPLVEVITPSGRKGLDCLLGDVTTAKAEAILTGTRYGEFTLKKALKGADYDHILIDCPPSVGLCFDLALEAADWLLIPTRCDRLAIIGVMEVLDFVHAHEELAPPGGATELLGILPTFYERVTRESFERLKELVARFGDQVLPPIPTDTKLREAPVYGETIWEYALNTRALTGIEIEGKFAGGYKEVLRMIIKKLGGTTWVQRAKAVRRGL